MMTTTRLSVCLELLQGSAISDMRYAEPRYVDEVQGQQWSAEPGYHVRR